MKLPHPPYVPVLKIKRGEKSALGQLNSRTRAQVTPLLECVERRPDKSPTVEGHLDTMFNGLAESVRHFSQCFLDAGELTPDGAAAKQEAFDRAAQAGINFTPVTGLSRLEDRAAVVSYRSKGLALRVKREELEHGDLSRRLPDFLSRHEISPDEVDLILDLGSVEELVLAGISAMTAAFLAEIPTHQRWRTLTVLACAFPCSMGIVNRNSHVDVERTDWVAWKEGLFARRSELERLPAFGDYAIQHPSGVEGFDPKTMSISAAIRYAVDDNWLLVKGESTKLRPASQQFPDLATRLVYGHLSSRFAGAGHCAGCGAIKDAADGAERLGSPEVWRRIGTIHHITRVVQDLNSLPLP